MTVFYYLFLLILCYDGSAADCHFIVIFSVVYWRLSAFLFVAVVDDGSGREVKNGVEKIDCYDTA